MMVQYRNHCIVNSANYIFLKVRFRPGRNLLLEFDHSIDSVSHLFNICILIFKCFISFGNAT